MVFVLKLGLLALGLEFFGNKKVLFSLIIIGGVKMGKKTIPEQVEYFCDICSTELKKSNHDDFTLSIDEALYDFGGLKMNNQCDHYELCSKCTESFKSWLRGVQA